jgi:hypothetical protein
MSEVKNERVKIILGGNAPGKLVRMSYLHAHEARMNTQNGKMEFGVTVLIPKANVEDVKAVKAAIDQLKKTTWLDNKKPIPPQFWNPLRDGDKDTKQNGEPMGEECRGHYVVNCKSDQAPVVVGTTKGTDGKYLPIAKTQIKSGDWGRVSVSLYAYTKGLGGVGAGLANIQLVREGEALSGRSSAEDDFGQFEDMDSEENPLA